MGRFYRFARVLVWLALTGAAALSLYAFSRARPQDMPWTTLDLAQPVGLFTGRKLAALTQDYPGCRAALDKAGIGYAAVGPRGEGQCAHSDSMRLRQTPGAIRLSPSDVAPSCPVVAALKLWEWHVVQPAAERIYGQGVRQIDTLGSFNCRRMYGRSEGRYSEHATADAIDISAFVLEDGRRVRVLRDWTGEERDAAFLRSVRDGACDLYATVLSPDYNAAHADHFHLDQAERGNVGGRVCR